ncbi:hypothetical protein [Isoptericola croceus]|uniref:hypothetical protein n=1 Tax=Isoptericola croceus TaxID=3031406 RepID=UPI0023F6860D|nr:hypothetical protein [Isoptericola croceus]
MVLSSERLGLLATDRWSWLAAVLDWWFADPLTDGDGSTPDEIEACEQRAGQELPTALVEWFTLVGRRLRPVQDRPSTPANLQVEDGGLVVWRENQGAWAVLVDGEGRGSTGDDRFPLGPAPLSTVLHGMVLSDTLVAAWSGSRTGPLGQLAGAVRGGAVLDASAVDVEVVAGELAPLPVPGNPFWGEPPRGDGETVVRGDEHTGGGLEWMTATPAAFTRLGRLLPLDPARDAAGR